MATPAPINPAQDEGWNDLTSELAHAAELFGLQPLLQHLQERSHGEGNQVPHATDLRQWLTHAFSQDETGAFAHQEYKIAYSLLQLTNQAIVSAKYQFEAARDELNHVRGQLGNELDHVRGQLATAQKQNVAEEALKGIQQLLQQEQAPLRSSTAPRKSVMKDPERFTGADKDSLKRHEAFSNWRSKIRLRWELDSHDFPTEFSKTLHGAGLLDGRASQGVESEVQTILSNRDDPSRWPWATGDAFIAALERKYDTLDVKQAARRSLETLQQEGDFALYADFITEFQQLADRAKWDDNTRVARQVSRPDRRIPSTGRREACAAPTV